MPRPAHPAAHAYGLAARLLLIGLEERDSREARFSSLHLLLFNLVIIRLPEVRAQAPQLRQPVERQVAAQLELEREQLELGQQQVRPALRELLQVRYQLLVQLLQAQV